MASQGPTGCNDSWTEDTSVGANSWVSPNGALTAEAGGTMSCTPPTYRVMTNNHGFTIPTGATINGIQTEWRIKDSCIAEGTYIRLADGNDASIEALEVTDILLAFNEDMTTCPAKIKSITKLTVKEYYLITTTKRVPTPWEEHHKLEDFYPEQTIKATAEHPFFTINKVFVKVKDLKVGDELYSSYTRIDHDVSEELFQEYYPEEILDIQLIKEDINVFDITVDSPNTFIANNLWVHNKTLALTSDVSSIVLKTGAQAGSDYATGDSAWDTNFSYLVYGGAADLWGTTWTVSEINDAGFGAGWAGTQTINSVVMDYMRITVYYTDAAGTPAVQTNYTTLRTLTGVGF